jgi:lipopolysaccharide export system protein LptA
MKRALIVPMLCGIVTASGANAQPAPAAPPAAKPPAAQPAKSSSPILGKHDSNQPINIAADSVTADLAAKTVTYTGNVIVTQGDVRMHAETMKVNTDNGKANNILANGRVVVDSPASGTATGDAGVYDVANHLVTLTGKHVVLVHNKDVSSGTKLTVNLVTNIATFVGDKSQPGGGRVQGVFAPTNHD